MKDAIIEILKWIRESVRPIAVFLLLSALALFLPHSWLTNIGIDDWLQKYRPWIVLIFAGSLIWLGTFPIEQSYYASQKHKRLSNLAPDEKQALRPYILNNKTTHWYARDDAVAKNLVTLGLLSDTSLRDGVGNPSYSIDLRTYSYLRKHPKLVGIETKSK